MNTNTKRTFDLIISFLGLIFTSSIILISWLIASIETKSNGFFIQKRVERYGKLFFIIKIKTMKKNGTETTITSSDDTRITKSGKFLEIQK